ASKSPSRSASTAMVTKAQGALRGAVQKADKALQDAQAASTAVSVGCVGVSGVGLPGGGHVPTPTASPTDSSTSDPTTTGPTQAQLQQCSDVLAALSQAQAAVTSAQQAEQRALNGLARVLSQASQASSSPSSPSSSSSNSSRSGNQGSSPTSSSTDSASKLASNQAQVDQAEASLISAQVARDSTVLRAPISGRVVSVGVSKGTSASTSSTAVTLVGRGTSNVVVSVPLAQIANLKVSQKARVVVSGSSSPVDAVVSNVGILASTSSSGTTTYPVTVTLTGASPALQGIGASVTIVTGSASDALTVPSSAITTTGTRTTVAVYSAGKVTTTAVTVGVMGSTTASITSGLKAGQQVVLADLNASIPSSSTSGNGLRGFGNGGLGGGLGGGGGLTRFRTGG
ncbi:MAG: efflux RND transporter periplasmic adaptor subunit, partial [Marmoricola sp.]